MEFVFHRHNAGLSNKDQITVDKSQFYSTWNFSTAPKISPWSSSGTFLKQPKNIYQLKYRSKSKHCLTMMVQEERVPSPQSSSPLPDCTSEWRSVRGSGPPRMMMPCRTKSDQVVLGISPSQMLVLIEDLPSRFLFDLGL